jgi:hypothetical protein
MRRGNARIKPLRMRHSLGVIGITKNKVVSRIKLPAPVRRMLKLKVSGIALELVAVIVCSLGRARSWQ